MTTLNRKELEESTRQLASLYSVGKWCFVCDMPTERISEVDGIPLYICSENCEHDSDLRLKVSLAVETWSRKGMLQ